jgi:hypothetical protein
VDHVYVHFQEQSERSEGDRSVGKDGSSQLSKREAISVIDEVNRKRGKLQASNNN